MKKLFGLRTIAIWNGLRTLLMASIVFGDVFVLVKDGDPGGYALVPTTMLILTISAFPSQIASLIAYLEFGRRAVFCLDLLAMAAFGLISVGLFRRPPTIRRF